MKKVISILSIIYLLLSYNLSLKSVENPQGKAERCLDFMNYEDAVLYFNQAIEENPNLPDLRASKAFAYFQLGKDKEAIKALNDEMTLFPENCNTYVLLAYIYYNQNKLEEAMNTCHDFDTQNRKIIRRMEALKKRSKFITRKTQLERIFEEIKQNNPNIGLPYFILGIYYKEDKKYGVALKNLNLAYQRGYNPIECYCHLIDVELHGKKWDKAQARAEEALKREGQRSEFYFLKGYADYQLNNLKDAALNFDNSVKLKPYFIEGMKNLAIVYYRQNKFDEASHLFKIILKIRPYDFDVKFYLERSLQKEKYPKDKNKPELTKDIVDKVEIEYKYAMKNDINYVANVINGTALTLVKQGKISEAKKMLRAFLKINESPAQIYYNLGQLYNDSDEMENAFKYAYRAIKLKKDFKDAYDLIGNAFFKIQDYENSLHAYKEVLKIDPRDAMGHYNLGCAFYALEYFDEAEKSWKDAIQFEKKITKLKEKDKISEDELDISLIVLKAPVSLKAYKSLAKLYLDRSLIEEALNHYEIAYKLSPKDPELSLGLGKIYYAKKDMTNALHYFEKYMYLGGKEEAEVKKLINLIKEKKKDFVLLIRNH